MKIKAFIARNAYFLIAGSLALYYLIVPQTGIYDWEKEIIYLRYIRESLFTFQSMPYYLWNTDGLEYYPLLAQTGLFISNPETLLFSPFIFLVAWLKPVAFIKVFYLIHLILGMAGILLLSRRLAWDNRQLRIFAGLFLLSPIILQHLAIGYTPWINLLLFPLLMFFLLSPRRMFAILGGAMVLALIILQGGLHVAVWLAAFSALIKLWQACLSKRLAPLLDLLGIGLLTGLLAFARLYTAFLVLHDFSQHTFPGYSTGAFFKMALKLPLFFSGNVDDIESFIEFQLDGIPYWDAGVYWGPFLVLVMAVAALFAVKVLKREQRQVQSEIPALLIAALGVGVMSFGGIYSALAGLLARLSSIPAFEGVEKYPFRFAMMAYFGLALWFASDGLPLIRDLHLPSVWKTGIRTLAISDKTRRLASLILTWLVGLLGLGLILWLVWGQLALLNEISKAYSGSGLSLIEGLMSHQADLPLSAYLGKAAALSARAVTAALIGIVLGLGALLSLRIPGFIQRLAVPFLCWISRKRLALVEMLLLLPLLVASLSWMRVATATPVDRFEKKLNIVPEINVISPAGAEVKLNELTPAGLRFTCAAEQGQTCEIVLPIKARELHFFTIAPDPLGSLSQEDALTLELEAQMEYAIHFDTVPFKRSMLITLLAWGCALSALIHFNCRLKKKQA